MDIIKPSNKPITPCTLFKYTDLNSFYKTHEEEPAEKVAALLRRHRLLPVEIHNLLRTFHAVGVYVGCLDVCSGCIYMYNGCT